MGKHQSGRVLVGHVSVDSGLIWVGDPCYIIHRDDPLNPKVFGANWQEFYDKIYRGGIDENGAAQMDGYGVCTTTAYGDGVYPVYANVKQGKVMSITVDFTQEDPEENDDSEDEE